ncbi:prephenate dehydratase [Cohnella rhizosphaerae]|uniref:Prephenate dehydratase n=1 Tax=Cohnella rhizosphaerae TaxID=1457232 RepID=A0A9X4L054_9BACL|nr:prephenate dehydratase [Cohnella rhizosphaerae]MDG0813691.1 prephenate dehydratase [Cohnella rhizosphaerae]
MIRVPSAAVLPKGTFSDEAARYFFRDREVELRYHKMIADVFKSTAGGATDWSVIPIENTIDGSVSLHTDWLVHEVELPIRAEWVFPAVQNLVGRLGELALNDSGDRIAARVWDSAKIVKIFSHPVAMAQCYEFIRAHIPHAELETLSSTAEAIRTVHDNPGQGWAAIGTRTAAADYGLDILQESVTDHDNNYTRFLLVGHRVYEAAAAPKHKTSILITLPEDYPGALHQVLAAFSWRKINLSRIESRPTKKKLGSYYFWIDIEMSLDTVLLPAAIAEIEAIGCQVRILGSYPSFPFEG